MSEEKEAFREAIKLLKAVGDSCHESSPYYDDHVSLDMTPHKELGLMIIANDYRMSRLDIAQQSFRMGVYLALQYKKLERMAR